MAVYVTDREHDEEARKPLKHLDLWCAARGQALSCAITERRRRPLPTWRRADGIEIRLIENPDHGKDSFDTAGHLYERCDVCFKPRMLRQQTARGRVYAGQPPLPSESPPPWFRGAIADAEARQRDRGLGGFVYEFSHERIRAKHIGGARDAAQLRARLLHHFNSSLRGEGVWWWYDLMREGGAGAVLELDVFGPLAGRFQEFENERRRIAWSGGWQNSTLV